MIKQTISVINCKPGMILAEEIMHNGVKLASKNTVLNSYIIGKLIELGEYNVCLYAPENNASWTKESNIIEDFKRDYELDIKVLKEIIVRLTMINKMNTKGISEISKSIIGYIDEPNAVIECLNTLKKADEYTYTHCINVAIYSMLIAKWMNLSLECVKEVIQAGLLHDIGKSKISNKILNKPYKLTNEEFNEIKKHTIFGYNLANQYNNINKNVTMSILMHHERIDGSGYPFGKTEENIVLGAKIVSVADTFDAMTSDRVYQKGVTPFKAFKMFLTEGIKLYDTSVIFTFLENISAHYIGMKAILENGKIGEIVYIPPKHVLDPIIKVEDRLIDFSKEKNLNIVNIFV